MGMRKENIMSLKYVVLLRMRIGTGSELGELQGVKGEPSRSPDPGGANMRVWESGGLCAAAFC